MNTARAMITEERRTRVASMLLARKSQSTIAKELGFSKTVICHDVAAIKEAWRFAQFESMDDVIARELAQLDELTEKVTQAWGQRKDISATAKAASVIIAIMERRAKLLGLDAAQRYEFIQRVEVLSDAQLKDRIKAIEI